MIITFCGHSDFRATQEYRQRMESFFEEHVGDQRVELYLGDYGGFDRFAYACGKEYQATHPNVRLVFVTPYFDERYQKKQLSYQKERYDEIVYPELERVPPRVAIIRRNQWMVERADWVVAYVTHHFGGAYQTYRYAQQKKKNTFLLSEKSFS